MSISQAVANEDKRSLRFPPGPEVSPVRLLFHKRSGDRLGGIVRTWQQYGDIVHTKLGPLHNYMLFKPEYVHHVLVANQKNYVKGPGYDGLRLLAGQGLLTSDGELWKEHRRMMSPYFTPAAVTSMYSGVMVETLTRMLQEWEQSARRGELLNMDHEMLRLTTSIIGRVLFSSDLSSELTEVGQAFQGAFAFIPARVLNPIVPIALPLPANQQFKRNLKLIDEFIAGQIELGRRNPERDNLLSVLLKAQDPESGHQMTDKMLRDEAVILFFAGFETTARSLTWAWYLLSQHPDVMAQLTSESDSILGGRSPQSEDLDQLIYTRQVVDETLRLYPPTAVLARQNVGVDEIGGFTIPPKSLISLVVHVVHRYPAYWPDAERFDPRRFTPEASSERPKLAYIPFSTGPRICLGNNFALMEMVYTLAMAAARFHMQRVDQEEIKPNFVGTTRPERPLVMKPVLRK